MLARVSRLISGGVQCSRMMKDEGGGRRVKEFWECVQERYRSNPTLMTTGRPSNLIGR
jgi:hypothetical protein